MKKPNKSKAEGQNKAIKDTLGDSGGDAALPKNPAPVLETPMPESVMTVTDREDDAPSGAARKPAAAPGIIAKTDIGAGDGKAAAQSGGDMKYAESTLVGDGTNGRPAAQPKPAKDAAPAAEPAPAAKAEPEPKPAQTQTTAPAPVVQKTGFWPVVLGGVVAAGLGAGAALYLAPQDRAATGFDHDAAEQVARRVVAQELDNRPAAVVDDSLRSELDAVTERVAALENSDAPAGDDSLRADLDAVAERVAALEDAPTPPATADDDVATTDDVAALQQTVDDQQARLDDLAALQQKLDEQAQKLDEQQAVLDEQRAQIATLKDRPSFDPEAAILMQQQIENAAEKAEQRLAEAQAEAQALQDAAAETTRRAQAIAAVASLQAALDHGVTPDHARDTLNAAGLDAPDALRVAVPSLAELQADYAEAARVALRASLRQDSAGGGNLVTNFLRAQTGARSVTAREGTDPDAILSRANVQVQAGDIAAALTELAALPDSARAAPAMADWLTRAQIHHDAQAALADLSSQN
ncbi:COG4223 family protein [Paracoccus sp. (in: a-proteobacteria)]|uniref:COG4223 family protein n=1 Tax=Paracoccus sp. TaxID=267 RepID=UPI0026DF55AF|nr:hypothetical protein [Paracoccus sp. (in: a-proteobacteria)]MDO5647217.1 hypothetical protein [Paracoccus sp. (in: a-proteobacteria)]